MPDSISDIADSKGYAVGGLWSGTECRYQQHYIAVIPECRYVGGEPNPPKPAVRVSIPKKVRPRLEYIPPQPEPEKYVPLIEDFQDRIVREMLEHGYEAGKLLAIKNHWPIKLF